MRQTEKNVRSEIIFILINEFLVAEISMPIEFNAINNLKKVGNVKEFNRKYIKHSADWQKNLAMKMTMWLQKTSQIIPICEVDINKKCLLLLLIKENYSK